MWERVQSPSPFACDANLMTIKDYVLKSVDPDKYYESRFPRWNARVRGNVRCPFHPDGNPSLAIGLRNGGARCHASTCAKRVGNIVHFESLLKDLGEKQAAIKLYQEFVRPIISQKTILQYKEGLADNPLYLLKIKKEMGLSFASIKKFSLGFDTQSHRITIPVYDRFSNCVNIRFYRLPSERTKADKVKIYNLNGYGRLDLYPIASLVEASPDDPIYFMAGEKDTLLALDRGLRAITSTAGEGSWDPEWNHLFNDRTVYLVFDADEGGRSGIERIRKFLAGTTARTHELQLPFKSRRPDRKDFTDWILREGHSVSELAKNQRSLPARLPTKVNGQLTLAKQWDSHTNGKKDLFGEEIPDGREYPKLPDFASDAMQDLAAISSRSELLNRRIKTQGIVAAKSSNTYSIPWRFNVQVRNRPAFDYELPMGRELLSFVRSTDSLILQRMQALIGSNAQVIPIKYLTVTEVEVIPIAVVDRDVPYVMQRCYYFGERIEANVPYYLEVIPTSEIRTQETIGIITQHTPVSKSIDRFDMTPSVYADLSVFRPDGGSSVWNKLKSVADEISNYYTRVRNRLEWHIVALLTWASPIGWRFPDDPELQRGWLNSLAVGDTQTGKSKVTKNLRRVFNCGVFVSSENCTYVGLVGGAIKMGSGQLMLRWGRIPLSDKQMVILEELSGLSVEEISNMSDLRSSGLARLDKGGINSETNARTRLLCLSNVRSERKRLADYLFGVYAVRDLVGHGEDIARFDLITTLVDTEVSNEVINAKSFAFDAKTFSESEIQTLIHFIWSLTPEQIEFSIEAYEACLDHTKLLATEFHPSIPIFKGGSGRYQLGRIAAAIACLQFAWDYDAGKICITKEHVEAAVKFLRIIYTRPSLGYGEYSKQMFERETIKSARELTEAFTEKIPRQRMAAVLETLIHATRFSRDELCAIGGFTILHADQLIGSLVRNRAIRKGDGPIWEIVPAGKTFMEGMLRKYGSGNRPQKLPNNNRKEGPRKLVRPSSGPKRVL